MFELISQAKEFTYFEISFSFEKVLGRLKFFKITRFKFMNY